MEKIIFTSFTSDELKKLIYDAILQINYESFQKKELLMDEEIYLSQQEVAKFLRISFPTLIRWKKENKIPYYQEGKTVLFKKSEILNVLQKNKGLL